MALKNSGFARENAIRLLCDGIRTSAEIAEMLGDNAKYVQRTMKKYDLPRLPQAPRRGKHNPSFLTGRRIDRDGYAIVSAPLNHPYARMRKDRAYGIIAEHRLIAEKNIGRFLLPSEVVDHIDGLRLHNCPSNLRIFDSNADHLKATITGQIPKWSLRGLDELDKSRRKISTNQPAHTYLKMKKSGDARLIEILHTVLTLGIDSPYLLGTHHHLTKVGIFDLTRSSLELELVLLYRKYA